MCEKLHAVSKSRLAFVLAVVALVTVPGIWAATADAPGPYYYRPVEKGEPTVLKADIAVYGGTPAGVAAAVQSARLGRKTILLSFNRHVGGMTSGGLTATDIGNRESVGGLALEFYNRLGKVMGFRPSEAEALYLRMLKESGVQVLFERCLSSVTLRDNRITSVSFETGETVQARVFIDATYEGDLMAAAKVSYRVGRESASTYDESAAGALYRGSWENVYQFCHLIVDPYREPGNAGSGLLPEISAEPHGAFGHGDAKVQAYNFRMFLTDAADRVPFPRPRGYDPERYGLLARFVNLDPRVEWRWTYTVSPMTDGPVQLRRGDCNNAGSFSTDYVGGSHRWPDGTYQPGSWAQGPPVRRGLPVALRELYELRERIFQDHVNYQQGLMFFLANDTKVPEAMRRKMNSFGLDPGEFAATGFWPHQLYVREARRMVSDYVMTQKDCESKRAAGDSVGLASYPMDSHFCHRYVAEESVRKTVRNEGGWTKNCPRPYPISYRALVPKKTECTNLLVPVCLSASHVAYGSVRMEPVFMILGQSAGTAAVLAMESDAAVQDVDYEKLRKKLTADGQLLHWK